ncbi:Unknown protein [Striga hermonthica]|uniref:Protein kinase domain-containing protein n=1 Tax=Striga hermonthica TaxID=68872 RepID=A0A9N7NB00_STRHE|nr:Unknown protein [Striga hermonthica]
MKNNTTTKQTLLLSLSLSLCGLFLFSIHSVQAQPSTIGFNCTPPTNQSSPNSCQTYVYYRAASPDYLDLAAVGDLFSVSRLEISRPSNISAANATLAPAQPLLVPVTCSCHTVNVSITISYAALNYTILSGDTFYRVSTVNFQNLTTYQSVEVVNPTFEPTRLEVGDVIVFPIFCRCPNSSQVRNRVNYLVSYVFQPADRLSDVASRLGSTQQSIIDVNGNNIRAFDTIFVPVSRLPNFTQPTVAPPNPNNRNSNNTNNTTTTTNINGGDDNNRGLEIGLGIGLGICGIVLILVCAVWWYRERKLKRGKGEFYGGIEEKLDMGRAGSGLKAEEVNLMADVSGCLDKYRVFGIEDLKKATEGFDDKCLIQGSVYKGCIDGEFFAIKKMKWNAYEELKILQKVNHGNLVRLEGFCIDPQEANCYLVYEYVENGSLHSWLHDPSRAEKLSWKTRLVSGREAVDGPLWATAREVLEDGRAEAVREWVDGCVGEEEMESAVGVLGLGVACVDGDPVRRPSMVEIVYALSKSGGGEAFLDLSEEGFSPRKVVDAR